MFDRALSESEIQAIYDAQKPAGMAVADTGENQLYGIASMLNAIQEAIDKLKSLF